MPHSVDTKFGRNKMATELPTYHEGFLTLDCETTRRLSNKKMMSGISLRTNC